MLKNKNLLILILCQIFSFTAPPVIVFLSSIIGFKISPISSLSTLPMSLAIVGTASFTFFAAKIMSKIGRKKGFIYASLLTTLSSLLAAYSIFLENFYLFCLSCFLIGAGVAVTHQYRFAAAEAVGSENTAKAISYLMLAGIISGILGPNIANFSKNIFLENVYVGSYLALSFLTFLPVLLFYFYTPEEIKMDKKKLHIRNYSELLKNPRIFQAIISGAFGYAVMAFLMTATPLSMHQLSNINIGKISIVMQFHIIGMFLPSIFTGKLIIKYGHSKMIYCGSIIFLTCIAFSYFEQNFINYLISLILLGIGWNFVFITSTDLLVKNYSLEERFKAQGFNDLIVFSVQATASLSAGYFILNFGWSFVNVLCIPLVIIILIVNLKADMLCKNSKEYKNV